MYHEIVIRGGHLVDGLGGELTGAHAGTVIRHGE